MRVVRQLLDKLILVAEVQHINLLARLVRYVVRSEPLVFLRPSNSFTLKSLYISGYSSKSDWLLLRIFEEFLIFIIKI